MSTRRTEQESERLLSIKIPFVAHVVYSIYVCMTSSPRKHSVTAYSGLTRDVHKAFQDNARLKPTGRSS
jgi:hypothetical protein